MKQDSYRKVFKGTAIFGGVQVFQILISLIRGKFLALFLGANGMGISSMYVSSLAIVITLAGLGCTMSSVRFISNSNKDNEDYYKNIIISKRIFLFISLFGLLLTLIFSVPLSLITFKSKEHIISYCILSLYVFFSLYNQGLSSILQGMQQLKIIAIGNVIPSFLALLITIPCYYQFKIKAIVPMLIILPMFLTIYLLLMLKKEIANNGTKNKIIIKQDDVWKIFKNFISLGIVTVIAYLLGNITTYLINTFISYRGTLQDIGFLQASTSITNQYLGLILSALAIDYFPRLSAVCNDNIKMNETVNSQGEIILLLALPLISILMVASPLFIHILLTSEFLTITELIIIISYGMIFKFASYCLGYISFAKGDKKTYFWFEAVFSNILSLLFNCGGYYFYGLKGLAIGVSVNYAIYLIIISLYTRRKYQYKISKDYFRIIIFSVIFSSIQLFLVLFNNMFYKFLSWVCCFFICLFSLIQLNKKIDLIQFIKSKITKK